MNEIYSPEIVSQAANGTAPMDNLAALGLMAVLVALFVLGMVLGIAAARPSTPRATVLLRALRHYLESPQECNDELVKSLVRRDIRSLEQRLNLDNDE